VSREPFPSRGEDSREPADSAFPPAPEDDWDPESAIDALADEYEMLSPDWLTGEEPAPLEWFSGGAVGDWPLRFRRPAG
jgi:hypothetical protein